MIHCKRVFSLCVVVVLVMTLVSVVTAEEQKKINLNTASAEELVQIKGIGNQYAQRIIEYREKNGPFNQVEDIMNIKGIGSKTFESIKGSIMVELSEE
jgi:competence protein ComEA